MAAPTPEEKNILNEMEGEKRKRRKDYLILRLKTQNETNSPIPRSVRRHNESAVKILGQAIGTIIINIAAVVVIVGW